MCLATIHPTGCPMKMSLLHNSLCKPGTAAWWLRGMLMSLLVAKSNLVEARSPLRLHPDTPHYLLFRGKPVVLVTSAAHYGMVINLDFDYLPYLETLHTYGMNLTRLFVGSFVAEAAETPWIDSKGPLSPRPDRLITPWARSTVPGYHNGGNKFDLDRWDEAYFRRLKDYVIQAGQRGIVVEVVLFGNQYKPDQWYLSPLYGPNNIQGVSDVRWDRFQTLTDPALVQRQV